MNQQSPFSPELHDATLLSVALDWRSGTAALHFRTANVSAPNAVISGIATRLLQCPREMMWGPSVSVNRTMFEESGVDGVPRLEIEMQTGDVIVLVAERIEFVACPPGASP